MNSLRALMVSTGTGVFNGICSDCDLFIYLGSVSVQSSVWVILIFNMLIYYL